MFCFLPAVGMVVLLGLGTVVEMLQIILRRDVREI